MPASLIRSSKRSACCCTRAPHGDRAHLDNLIALYGHSAAEYAVLRDAVAAMPTTEDAENDLRRNARAVLAADARTCRAGLLT